MLHYKEEKKWKKKNHQLDLFFWLLCLFFRQALRSGYPAERAYKLHYRRALALSKTRGCSHCIYEAAKQALAGAPQEDKDVRAEMERMMTKISKPNDKHCEKKAEPDVCLVKIVGTRAQSFCCYYYYYCWMEGLTRVCSR